MRENIASKENSAIRVESQISSDGQLLKSSRLLSFELWLASKIEHMSFVVALIFAFSCWFFTDDAIKLLPFGENIKNHIQESGIFIIIFLFICSIIIYWIQQRQKQRNTRIADNYLKLRDEHSIIQDENNQLKEELSQSREKIRSLCEGYLYSLANGPLKEHAQSIDLISEIDQKIYLVNLSIY